MFALLAGGRSAEADGDLERMAQALFGGTEAPRLWRDPQRRAAAASLKPDFVPEDVFDAQPTVAAEHVFVCQARIDNREDLLRRLDLSPTSRIADSALLEAAFGRWGQACVHHICGDFAYAAWLPNEGRIVAAVDPLGARRLMWAKVQGGLALAGQLPALLANPNVSREPDLHAIGRMLDAGLDRTTTPFASVRNLPGGHVLSWRNGEMHVERWWRPDWKPTVWYRNPRDYVDEAKEIFTGAVKVQLRSRAPISSTLSGGLDSGCMTAVAAKFLSARGERLTAYTSVPEAGVPTSERLNWDPDDRAYAAQVAALYSNIDHRLVPPGGRSAIEVAERLQRRSLTPTKSATNLLWLEAIYTSMNASGSRILLVGQHGNAAFSTGGQGSVLELARLGRLGAALSQARLEAQARRAPLFRVLLGAIRGGLRQARGRTMGASIENVGLAFIKPPYRSTARDRINDYAEVEGSRALWATSMMTPRHVWSPDPALHDIEWRDPTADRRLLERLIQFPQAAFRFEGRDRGLCRELAAGLLPDAVRYRSTRGAQVPEAPGLIGLHIAQYRVGLAAMNASPLCREFLDLKAIGRAVDKVAADPDDYRLGVAVDRAFGAGLFIAGMES